MLYSTTNIRSSTLIDSSIKIISILSKVLGYVKNIFNC